MYFYVCSIFKNSEPKFTICDYQHTKSKFSLTCFQISKVISEENTYPFSKFENFWMSKKSCKSNLLDKIFLGEIFNSIFFVQTKFELFCSVLEDIKNDLILKLSAQEWGGYFLSGGRDGRDGW